MSSRAGHHVAVRSTWISSEREAMLDVQLGPAVGNGTIATIGGLSGGQSALLGSALKSPVGLDQ